MDIGLQVLFTGIGATALMDGAMLARERILGVAKPDYGFVGRWLAHMAHGQFAHARIAAAPAVRQWIAATYGEYMLPVEIPKTTVTSNKEKPRFVSLVSAWIERAAAHIAKGAA